MATTSWILFVLEAVWTLSKIRWSRNNFPVNEVHLLLRNNHNMQHDIIARNCIVVFQGAIYNLVSLVIEHIGRTFFHSLKNKEFPVFRFRFGDFLFQLEPWQVWWKWIPIWVCRTKGAPRTPECGRGSIVLFCFGSDGASRFPWVLLLSSQVWDSDVCGIFFLSTFEPEMTVLLHNSGIVYLFHFLFGKYYKKLQVFGNKLCNWSR